jgi:uncharacterized Fe-S cluster-containing MiaB family protein
MIGRKLDRAEVKDKNQVEISNRFAALENLDERAWESLREYIKTSAKEKLGYHRLTTV